MNGRYLHVIASGDWHGENPLAKSWRNGKAPIRTSPFWRIKSFSANSSEVLGLWMRERRRERNNMSSEVSASERIGRRLGGRLNRASSAIDRKSDDVYAHVAGALYRVFLTLATQATRAYFIFVIKLFVWSIVPLTTVIAILFQLALLSPILVIVCYVAIVIIIWTVLTRFIRSLRPPEEPEAEAPTGKPLVAVPVTGNRFFVSGKAIISALNSILTDFFKGQIKPLFTLGLLIRIVGLGGFLFLSYARELLGAPVADGLSWLKNDMYWLEYGVFDVIVAQPIINVVRFVIETANSFGFNF